MTKLEPDVGADRFLFRHFWTLLAVGGGLAEWALCCWLAPGRVPPALHVLGPLGLAILNRVAARVFQPNPPAHPLAEPLGRLVLATAFTSVAGVAALGVTSVGWLALGLVIGFQAEAGVVSAGRPAALFGPGFRPLADLAIATVMAVFVHGFVRGHRLLAIVRLDVPMLDLPAALDGLRLVHLSDLHLGPLAHRGALREALAAVAALEPDLVCVTGDLIDSPATDLASWVPELAAVSARHGVYAILGNHDRNAGCERVAAAVARWTGWHVLRDAVATVEIDGARLHLVGLEDRPERQAADRLRPLLAALPPGEAAVLLAHRPSVFPAAATAGIPLTLAGHTHGGQLAVPGIPGLNAARLYLTRYDAGTFWQDASTLHVSRGLGTSGQRVRVGVPRDITVVTLVRRVRAAA